MSAPTSTLSISYSDAAGTLCAEQFTVVGDPMRSEYPLVVLLHGVQGTANDMTSPGQVFDRSTPIPATLDRGWHAYPNVGIWSVGTDPPISVDGWKTFLSQPDSDTVPDRSRVATVAYNQIDNNGEVAGPSLQLTAMVGALAQAFPGKQLGIMAHSRGGVVARQFLVDNARNDETIGRIGAVITLHSPHQGSELANVA